METEARELYLNAPAKITARATSLYNERIPLVDISKAKSIGEHPDSERIAFPYEQTRPFTKGDDLLAVDVSGSGNNTCLVVPTYSVTLHNHAGAHADRPAHIGFKGMEFRPQQYTGRATIVDLAAQFTGEEPRQIEPGHLERTVGRLRPDDRRRLLFRTYDTYPDEWDPNGSHFSRTAAEYLASIPGLVLVGIDSASIDHPTQDTHKGAHLPIMGNGIAVLEGLRIEGITTERERIVPGLLHTTFVPHQKGEDAQGVIPTFTPLTERIRLGKG